MLPHLNFDVEIARRSTPLARLTLAPDPNPVAGVDAGRDGDRNGLLAPHLAAPAAVVARIGDDGSRTVAAGTGLLDREETLLNTDLALTGAGPAGRRRRARGGSSL